MIYKVPTEYISKPWGYEEIIVNNLKEGYCSKILNILPGKHSSYHKHVKKHETFLVLEGTLTLCYLGGKVYSYDYDVTPIQHKLSVNIVKGEVVTIEREQLHQLQNNTTSLVRILETSTPHYDDDSLRESLERIHGSKGYL